MDLVDRLGDITSSRRQVDGSEALSLDSLTDWPEERQRVQERRVETGWDLVFSTQIDDDSELGLINM